MQVKFLYVLHAEENIVISKDNLNPFAIILLNF